MRAWLGCGRKGPSPAFLGVRRGAHHLLPVATAQPLSMSAFFAAAAFTSSGRTCGAAGSLSATLSGSFTPGTEGRTKPWANIPCPISVMMKLSHSLPALGLGPLSTRLIAYGAAAEASLGITTATASPRPSVYLALRPSFSYEIQIGISPLTNCAYGVVPSTRSTLHDWCTLAK